LDVEEFTFDYPEANRATFDFQMGSGSDLIFYRTSSQQLGEIIKYPAVLKMEII
jgi:hypothetical protein